jgi:hypothetical protein
MQKSLKILMSFKVKPIIKNSGARRSTYYGIFVGLDGWITIETYKSEIEEIMYNITLSGMVI